MYQKQIEQAKLNIYTHSYPIYFPPLTPLYHAKTLGNHFGINNLYFKLESFNLTGTYKDRAAKAIVQHALNNNKKGITVGTCGNYGAAIAYFAAEANLLCNLFIPDHYKKLKIPVRNYNKVKITYIRGTYEYAVEASSEFAKRADYFNGNPIGESALIAMRGYQNIATELLSQLNHQIDQIWISVGNGTGLAGIYQGFITSSNIPAINAVSSLNNNAIIKSILNKKPEILAADSLHETHINEPLLNWKSYQVNEALEAVLSSGGIGVGITDEEMVRSVNILSKSEHLITTPASAAAFAGFIKSLQVINRKKCHIIILTS